MRKLLIALTVLCTVCFACNPDANKAKKLADKGEYREAIKYYKAALEKDKDNPRLHNELGYAFRRAGHFELAVDQYEKAVSLKPDYVEAHYNLGVVKLKMGRNQSAKESFDQAIKLNPSFAKAHISGGLACYRLRMFDEAKAHYDEALRLQPDNSALHCNLAVYWSTKGNKKEEQEAQKRCDVLKSEGK